MFELVLRHQKAAGFHMGEKENLTNITTFCTFSVLSPNYIAYEAKHRTKFHFIIPQITIFKHKVKA